MRTHLVRSKWIKGMRRQDTRFGTRSLTETGRQLWMSLHNWRDNQFFRSEPDEGVVLDFCWRCERETTPFIWTGPLGQIL